MLQLNSTKKYVFKNSSKKSVIFKQDKQVRFSFLISQLVKDEQIDENIKGLVKRRLDITRIDQPPLGVS